ncbi:mercury(II) reductase [Desulfuromonas sp. TF]|uniref:mercury(II) reductase n=1 Tax=Desulfuromonas sp. TF TaxID=1232410 RepID=UPI000428E662|nr:mercury(II) reductase [Desulfuromonas sp. TF]
MTVPYDIVILGSGSTAFAASMKAAERGARVLMVEQSRLGGTCVNWGCIPSKTLIHKAQCRFEAMRGEPYGLNMTAEPPDCGRLMAAKKEAVETLRREHYQKVLDGNPLIDVLRGHGRFRSSRELQVGAEILIADRFLIACGGIPRVLNIPGLTEVDYLTSYSALHLPCFPESLVIIGGGVIALEMGQMFRRFGTEVTILEHGPRLLKDFDPRLTDIFQQILEDEGIELVLNANTQRVFKESGKSCLVVDVEGSERIFCAERVMLAVGTAPATEGIGLDAAGVRVDDCGFIVTDEEMRTTAPGIWAAGDVTGPPLIAPAGAWEGEVAVENMLDPETHRKIDHRHTPMAVFVDPEFAVVGLSLERARREGREVLETFFDLEDVSKAHVMGERKGGILILAERGSGQVLGVQMLAPRAADVIHEAALAVRFGLTVHDLAQTIHIYPTISEGLRLAALENIRQQEG